MGRLESTGRRKRMGTRFRFLAGVVVPGLLLSLSACTTSSSSTPSGSGPGALFVATQGDSSVSAYTIDLTTGTINANGDSVPTGSVPSAMILAPSGTALFIANSNSAIPPNSPACTLPSPGTITAYTVSTDGTLTAASGSPQTGVITPLAMAIDSGGHFLFVANQGLQCDPTSGTISVFAIKDATLTECRALLFPRRRHWPPAAPALREWQSRPMESSCTFPISSTTQLQPSRWMLLGC